jgi:quinone-modifying oxidoreductase subunit QmoC
MAVVRQEVISQYSFPGFLGKWVNSPKYVLPLLAIPAVLLGLALLAKDQIGNALGFSAEIGDKVSFPYSPGIFPHWLLNTFFFFFSALALVVAVTGIVRFWNKLKASDETDGIAPSDKSVSQSILAALKKIFVHDNFTLCSTPNSRFLPHFGVFFGFIALSFVTLWAITSSINPLMQGEFVYPFNFWNPLKILANLGGAAVLIGCLFMIYERIYGEHAGNSTYSDWAFLLALLVVVGTGFVTELLHYARLVPHRHIAYFIHLVFVFALIVYLPYSKFAHLIYRTAALAYLEFTGRGPADRSRIPAQRGIASNRPDLGDKAELQANKSTA